MAELSHLNRPKHVTANIELGDGDLVRITFDRNRMTRAWDTRVRNEQGFAEGLAEVIVSWEIEDNGQPLPPTVENINRLSIPAQGTLYQQIITASLPSSAEGEVSSGGSSPSPRQESPASTPPPQENPQTLPNGAAPSQSPAPSASPSPT